MNSCFCEDENHEICFDGLIGIYNENCKCCKQFDELATITKCCQ